LCFHCMTLSAGSVPMGISLVDMSGRATAYSGNRDLIPELSQSASTLVNVRPQPPSLQEAMNGAEGA
jgi:hypothetical protein